MKKSGLNKKNLIVLGFDNCLYYNAKRNFTLDIAFEDILESVQFFNELSFQVELLSNYDFDCDNTHFLLMSGRDSSQKDVILLYLHEKGFSIKESYFCNFDFLLDPHVRINFDEDLYKIKYWAGKVELIHRISRSEKYNSIIVIESNDVVCTMLKELGITTIQPTITKSRGQLHVKFIPFNQKSSLHLLEKEVLVN